MITTAEAPRNGGRIVAVTIAASLALHALALVAAQFASFDLGSSFVLNLRPNALPTLPPQDEIVTISRAVRIAPRARIAGGRRMPALAFAQPARNPFASSPISRPNRATQSAFARGFARTVARTHPDDTQAVSRDPATAPKRYQLQLRGKLGHLRHGEGIYYPVRGWRSGGLDYYYVAYQFTYADGTIESGNVPWPIHFAPDEDPFVSTDASLLQRTPLPAPPPGFVPPGDLGKTLRAYFPSMQFEDAPG